MNKEEESSVRGATGGRGVRKKGVTLCIVTVL